MKFREALYKEFPESEAGLVFAIGGQVNRGKTIHFAQNYSSKTQFILPDLNRRLPRRLGQALLPQVRRGKGIQVGFTKAFEFNSNGNH